jgi:hypothetical protein
MARLRQVRRGLRTLVVGVALGACVIPTTGLVWTSTAYAGAPPASVTVARDGAGWLARQIAAHGGSVASAPDPTDTAYAVLGLHAAGVGRAASAEAMHFLETHLSAVSSGGSDVPGTLADFILAAHASGVDPRHFGGTAAKDNLVARLIATSRATGADRGLFGSQDPSFDGAFRQGLALAALKAAGGTVSTPAVARGIAWLERQQCANGLWESYRSDTSTPCPPADPKTFTGPDTNSTSLAVQGLAAYGNHPHQTSVLHQLHVIQSSAGGFPFVAAAGQSSDPDSTALVIQAIIDEGQNPGSTAWVVSGATPYSALAAFQLGCAAPAANRGAFFFPGSTGPSLIATVQAVPAAAGKVLPIATSNPSTSVPTVKC